MGKATAIPSGILCNPIAIVTGIPNRIPRNELHIHIQFAVYIACKYLRQTAIPSGRLCSVMPKAVIIPDFNASNRCVSAAVVRLFELLACTVVPVSFEAALRLDADRVLRGVTARAGDVDFDD